MTKLLHSQANSVSIIRFLKCGRVKLFKQGTGRNESYITLRVYGGEYLLHIEYRLFQREKWRHKPSGTDSPHTIHEQLAYNSAVVPHHSTSILHQIIWNSLQKHTG